MRKDRISSGGRPAERMMGRRSGVIIRRFAKTAFIKGSALRGVEFVKRLAREGTFVSWEGVRNLPLFGVSGAGSVAKPERAMYLIGSLAKRLPTVPVMWKKVELPVRKGVAMRTKRKGELRSMF